MALLTHTHLTCLPARRPTCHCDLAGAIVNGELTPRAAETHALSRKGGSQLRALLQGSLSFHFISLDCHRGIIA